jgi:phage terminase small subunit
MDFLSKNGIYIYKELEKHCREKLNMYDVDKFELAMLANSFDLYQKSAKYCLDYGVSMSFPSKDAPDDFEELDEDEKETVRDSKSMKSGGVYQQIRPEYTVMKNEYQNILKHSAKFGLNPGDREKIFKSLANAKPKKKDFGKMRIA